MTFVAGVLTRHTLWMVADRRLSRGAKTVEEHAVKLMTLETTDGIALLGYAGLGATTSGTQPSEWMSRIVRGRNWPLQHSLDAIADGMKLRLPRHLRGVPGGHIVVAPAFERRRRQLYSIDIAADPFGRQKGFRYTRWNISTTIDQPPQMVFTGSGSSHLPAGNWRRELSHLVNAHDRKRVSALAVADELAKLNTQVNSKDGFTGPKSIVVWRYAKHGRHKGGGGYQFYEGEKRKEADASIPMISNGMDVTALGKTILSFVGNGLANLMKPENLEALDKAVLSLPDQPDDTFD